MKLPHMHFYKQQNPHPLSFSSLLLTFAPTAIITVTQSLTSLHSNPPIHTLYMVPENHRLGQGNLCERHPQIYGGVLNRPCRSTCVIHRFVWASIGCGAPGAPIRPRPVAAVAPARSAVVLLRAGCHPRQRSLILEVRFPPAPLRA